MRGLLLLRQALLMASHVSMFDFAIENNCRVDVDISCVSEDGVECTFLVADDVGDDCVKEITYTIDVTNVGTTEMTVTLIQIDNGGTVVDLTGELDDPALAPGEGSVVTYIVTIDLCVTAEYVTSARVEAEPPSEGMCENEEAYRFEITTGTPFPNPGPKPGPTPEPTPPPTSGPTPGHTPGPTPAPTPGPTPEDVTPEPTPGPTPGPTPEPTPPPTPVHTPGPTPGPTPWSNGTTDP